MNEFFPILIPIIGILGVIAGVLLNEFVRRRNRRELYAPKVFEKRLAIYEALAEHIHQGSGIASEVIDNDSLTPDQRHDLITVPISAIATYTDANSLYIDDELAAHCTALFMGVEDIHDASDANKERLLKDYYHMRKEALRMIAEDSGIAEMNRLFKTINRPKLSGPLIERLRELRREQR
ncbi:hypothetical protein ACEQ6A_08785 [Rhizobium brockwellii]|uniref:hypothetical protein n=1 Tax=Rhizobium brockwellii TaxID=3019932 RepID=UPI003F964586